LKKGQRTHVVLSLGSRRFPIPALEGKNIRAARLEVLRAGLQVGEVSSCYLPAEEPELILKQSPPAGQAGAGSPRVNVLVALGERETAYVMPDLVGLSLGDAQKRASVAGLKLTSVTVAMQAQVPHGSVVRQTPPRGARIGAGATVELQVAE
jgi:serine/threonine-protein kinase